MLHGASSHPLPLSLFIESFIESLSHATLSAEGRCLRVALRHAFLLPGRSLRSPHVTSTAYACERGGTSLNCSIYYNLLCELRRTPLKRSSRGELTYPIAPALMLQVAGGA